MNLELFGIPIDNFYKKYNINNDLKLNYLHINKSILREKGYANLPRTNEEGIYKQGIFLIHGVGGSSLIWLKQIPVLVNLNLDVISIDLLGHGQSSISRIPDHYTFENLFRPVFKIYDLHRRQFNVLIGHSYGCCFVTFIACRRRSSVKGIILTGCDSPDPNLGRQIRSCFPNQRLIKLFKNCLWKIFIKLSFKQSENHELLPMIDPLVFRYTYLGQHGENVDFNYSWAHMIPSIVIHGRRDQLMKTQLVSNFVQELPNCKLIVLNESGHMTMLDEANAFNRIITDFIKETLVSTVNVLPSR